MDASGDLSQRAAAGVLRANMARNAATRAFMDKQVRCEQSIDCLRKARESGLAATRDEANRLAAAVSAGRDPRAYGIAYQLCQEAYPEGRPEASCGRLTPRRWAELDPSNVIPWLFAASNAHAAGDSAAAEEAFRGAARASTALSYWMPQLAVASSPVVERDNPATRLVALMSLTGPYASVAMPDYHAVTQHCPMGLADEERRKACSAIATALVNGTGLMELSMGSAIGSKAGWPAAKVEETRQRIDAIRQAGSPVWDTPDYWSCDRLQVVGDFAATVVAGGEVAAGEAAIKASGRSQAELSRVWRERTARAEREFWEERQKK